MVDIIVALQRCLHVNPQNLGLIVCGKNGLCIYGLAKDLEMGKLSWIIYIDPNCNQDEGVGRRQRREKAV